MTIKLKRAYEVPAKSDGLRILVERLWPRGVTREKLRLDEWMNEIAPSADLRKWYGHDPDRWPEFQTRYRGELEANAEELARLREICAGRIVTFVFAAKDKRRNSAVVLKAYLEGQG